jgi:hypothetical protein
MSVGSPERIRSAVHWKYLLCGAGFVVAGLAAPVLVLEHGYRLVFLAVDLPRWSVWVFSGVALLFGAPLIVASRNNRKCTSCGRMLETLHLDYSVDRERDLFTSLETLEPGRGGSNLADTVGVPSYLIYSLDYCDRCVEVGELRLFRHTGNSRVELMGPREIVGRTVRVFVDFFQASQPKQSDEEEDD